MDKTIVSDLKQALAAHTAAEESVTKLVRSISDYRKKEKKSSAQMAKLLGTSQRMFFFWASGSRKPSIDQIEMMLKHVNGGNGKAEKKSKRSAGKAKLTKN